MSGDSKLFICEDCGQTTPVMGETCPNCNGKLVNFDGEDHEPSGEDLADGNLEKGIADSEVATQSLEDLASKEFEEDDEDYRAQTQGNSDE
ncbi:MAG: hypothetical protein WEC83_02375 [Patescibacteria group bacterium]